MRVVLSLAVTFAVQSKEDPMSSSDVTSGFMVELVWVVFELCFEILSVCLMRHNVGTSSISVL